MKSKQKAKFILIVLGIIFALSTLRPEPYTESQGETHDGNEMRNDINLKSPKTSAWWNNFSFITNFHRN